MSKFYYFAVAAATVSVSAVLIWYFGIFRKVESRPVPLAQCLRDRNITMYGARWCSHCQNEKRAFGDAFRYVPYVECPQNPNKCLALGIKGYPTWIFPDGRMFEGEQGLLKLAAASGCPLGATK